VEERRDAYRTLVGKTGRKRPLVKLWRRLEDNINLHFEDVEWGACPELM
jgi:hypothetical protein